MCASVCALITQELIYVDSFEPISSSLFSLHPPMENDPIGKSALGTTYLVLSNLWV